MRILEGKRVLITGASSGIGCAAAEAFARQGCAVALLARGREGLETVAGRLRAEGAEAHVVVGDLADRPSIEAAVEHAAGALGSIDVLVLNGASMAFGRFWEVDARTFEQTIASTFTGSVFATRAALPYLAADGGGAIVATGSVMARLPLRMFTSYAAAKHALRGFLNTLRIELRSARVPVRVSMIHPARSRSSGGPTGACRPGRLPRRPPDRYRPEEVARALVPVAASGKEEFTVGGEARAIELLYQLTRQGADRVLALVGRFYAGGRAPAPDPGMVFAASGAGECAGRGRWARPSFWARLRLLDP